MKLSQLLVFLILCGKDLEFKSPDYIKEKFKSVTNHDEPQVLLDGFNQEILKSYLIRWNKLIKEDDL